MAKRDLGASLDEKIKKHTKKKKIHKETFVQLVETIFLTIGGEIYIDNSVIIMLYSVCQV